MCKPVLSKENREYKRKLQRELHAGTVKLQSIYSFISSVSIFWNFLQGFKKIALKAGYNATNTFVSIKSVYSISKVYPSLSSDPFPAFVASRHSLRERWPFPLTTATESSFWAAGSAQTHTLWWLIEILQGPDRLQ